MASKDTSGWRIFGIIVLSAALILLVFLASRGCKQNEPEEKGVTSTVPTVTGAPFGPTLSVSVPGAPADTIIDESNPGDAGGVLAPPQEQPPQEPQVAPAPSPQQFP